MAIPKPTAGAMTAAGFGALGVVPSVIEAGAPFRQTEKERLAALERRAALGTLGFSDVEEQALQEQMLSPAQALARQQALQSAQLFAASGAASGGQGFAQMLAAQDAEQRRIAEAQAKIALEEARIAAEQRKEILALRSAEDKAKADRRAAIIGGIASVGGELFGMGLAQRQTRETLGEAPSRSNTVDSRYYNDFFGD